MKKNKSAFAGLFLLHKKFKMTNNRIIEKSLENTNISSLTVLE